MLSLPSIVFEPLRVFTVRKLPAPISLLDIRTSKLSASFSKFFCGFEFSTESEGEKLFYNLELMIMKCLRGKGTSNGNKTKKWNKESKREMMINNS